MGETEQDSIRFLLQLTLLPKAPQSVPINQLIPVKGTPLENTKKIDAFDFIRTIAVARIILPTSKIRLAAGRETMSPEMQALCFYAGANSIFYGDVLLTAKNQSEIEDNALLRKLDLKAGAAIQAEIHKGQNDFCC
jgi:biotin synthase